MSILTIPLVIYVNAFVTGVITKYADVANDDGLKISRWLNILLGILWGIFGSLVVFGNADIAAFYLGIIFSWILRYKLDNYTHGIGGVIILASIFYVHPISQVQTMITLITFVLFSLFGLLTRHKVFRKNIFVDYNMYSFIFLICLSIFYKEIWIVVIASFVNVIGYHVVKFWWKRKTIINQETA